MLTTVLLVAVVLGAEPLQGWVPGGKDILPDTPVSECAAPTISTESQFSPILDNYTAGSTLTFSCHNSSWTLIGQSVIVCQNDGQWSSNFPLCKYVICEELNAPDNVGITYDKSAWPLLPGTIAVYSCQENYKLDGTDKRTCSSNGSWSGPQPKCIGKCSPLTAPHNSSVMYSPRGCQHENCTATIKCDRGFNKVEDRKYTCNHQGEWTPDLTTSCSRIFCEPPGVPPEYGKVEIHPPPKDESYEYGIMLVYSCYQGYTLTAGKGVISCSGQGTWSGDVPKCTEVVETTAVITTESTPASPAENLTTTTQTHIASVMCPNPDPISNGEYRIYSRVVVYKCAHGYRLEGPNQRNCLVNQSWSGSSPECVLLERSTPRPFLWKQIFVDNKMWEGSYLFEGKPHHFKMWITSVKIHPNGDVGGLMVDESSKFNVKGFHSSESIVFQMSQLLKASSRFPNLNWYVSGQLERENYHWVYTGKVWSETTGFDTLTMRPSTNVPKAMPGHDTSPNMTALAMGITIAVISIIVAAVLAAFCVKRKVSFGGGGHRTLTSFENPVYEYENSLKDPGA